MDAVEFPFPAAITVSKLMGSEGCDVVGVPAKEVQSERVSIVVGPSSSSFPDKKKVAARNKMVNGEHRKRANQLSSPCVEEASKDLNTGSTSNLLLLLSEPEAKQQQRKSEKVPDPEAKQQQRKSGKVPKSNSGCSKRLRPQLEVSINETEADMKGKAKEGGLSPSKHSVKEKSQTLKQKTNLNGKRGDKRNGKAFKGKCDSFSVKNGLASFSSAAGGNNILGVYGSRLDLEDVTKHVDELSLNELLDGSYKCPSFTKDKGKKSANLNSNILHSVGEVWSILQTRKVKPQIVEIDGGYYRDNITSCLLTSSSSVASKSGSDKQDTNMTDLSSCEKVQDSGSKLKNTANLLDFPLYQPKDILERLALPPRKDLEFLLLDAAKHTVVSRNNSDLRLSKPVSYRGCLPPFSWSNASSGHCKSYSDAVKLSTSRSTCQGRWVKMENPITSQETTSCFLAGLQSLKYDHSLVPPEFHSLVPVVNEKELPKSVSITEQGLPSSATRPVDSQVSPDSPRALAAAQILSGMATHSSKKNVNGAIKWQKRPSQKSMRAHNFKPDEKSENTFAIPKSKPKVKSDSLVNTPNETRPSKKLKLSLNEKSADLIHNTTTAKGPLQWSMPRSSRASPSKSFRYPITETKHYNVNIVKKSLMMPPASRTFDTACSSSQPKPRKLMRLEWSREGGKLE